MTRSVVEKEKTEDRKNSSPIGHLIMFSFSAIAVGGFISYEINKDHQNQKQYQDHLISEFSKCSESVRHSKNVEMLEMNVIQRTRFCNEKTGYVYPDTIWMDGEKVYDPAGE